jgi:hypothetical protein
MENSDHLNESTIWKNTIFMKLFASYSVSMLGHWFDMIAIVSRTRSGIIKHNLSIYYTNRNNREGNRQSFRYC